MKIFQKKLTWFLLGTINGLVIMAAGFYFVAKVYFPNQIKKNLQPPAIVLEKERQAFDMTFNIKELQDTNTIKSLDDFSGKVIFLNYWEHWCAPCLAEMWGIDSLAQKFRGKELEFIIASSTDVEKNRSASKKFALPFYHYSDQLPNGVDLTTIPKTYIIDKKGDLVLVEGSANWYSSEVIELINNLLLE